MNSKENLDPIPESPTKGATEASMPVASSASYASDKPIATETEDRFNRWPFAKRVAETLAHRPDDGSLVVGLYGVWGDGKTSTLQLMQEVLKSFPDVVTVRFNPWHFDGQAQLVRGFFSILAEALDRSITTKSEKLGQILERYGGILSVVSATFGGVVQVNPGEGIGKVGTALSAAGLDDLRLRLETILREAGKRVVVFIDDIDRLDKDEVHAIFKLVKLSASFERVSYILAFDDEVVAAALGERYGAGNAEAGRRFLEKIVQVPLHLPPADELSLRALTFAGVDEAIHLAGLSLTQEQIDAFVRHFIDGLEPQLTTPRQAKRYVNALTFALPILKGEVNPVDQMLIEGIRVFYPLLYAAIRDNPDIFLGNAYSSGGRGDTTRQKAAELLDRSLGALDSAGREQVRSRLLEPLFPRLKSIFGNYVWGHQWDAAWEKDQKIASRYYFGRYFSYSVPPRDVPDQTISQFLEVAKQGDPGAIGQALHAFSERKALPRLIAKLHRLEGNMDTPTASGLITALVAPTISIPSEKAMLGTSTLTQTGILVARLLLRIAAGEQRDTVALKAVTTAPLPLALEIFRFIRADKDEGADDRVTTPVVEAGLGERLAERIKAAHAVQPLWDEHPADVPSLLWIWQTFGAPGDVTANLEAQFEKTNAMVLGFLKTYVPTEWGLESGLPSKGDLRRDAYDRVAKLVNPDKVATWLHTVYGPVMDEDKYHPSDDESFEVKVARQFCFIHRKVKSEAAKQTATASTAPGAVEKSGAQ